MAMLFQPDSKFSPELLTNLGIGLMTGTSTAEQLSNAALGASGALTAQKTQAMETQAKNQTVQMLQAQSPELAQAVASGIMKPAEAFGEYMKIKNQKAEFKTLDNGDYGTWDGKTFKKLGTAQKPVKPEFKTLDNGDYGTFDGEKFNRLGSAEKPSAPTELVRNLEAAGYKQGTPEFQNALMQAMKKPGMSLRTDEDGNVEFTQGDVPNSPKLTVDQSKNAGFLLRARTAEKELSQVEKEGTSTFNSVAGALPANTGNFIVSEDAQKYKQAQRNFVNAVLRKESGAVISDQEFANAQQQYFPQPGDKPQVIEQKRKNREDAIEGFRISAGPGAKPDDSNSETPSVEDLVKKYGN